MKRKIPIVCNIVSIILVIGFIIKSIVDYNQYSTIFNSALFSAQLLVNALPKMCADTKKVNKQ